MSRSIRRSALVASCLAVALAAFAAGCMPSGPKEVMVHVTDDGFTPAKIHVKKGEETVLVITRDVEATCATEAIMVESGQKYDLPLHQAVRIALPTEKSGTLHYACGMDMYHGEITVD